MTFFCDTKNILEHSVFILWIQWKSVGSNIVLKKTLKINFFYFFKQKFLIWLTSESLPAVILTLWTFIWYFVVVCGCTCYGFQVTLGLRCGLGSLLLKTIPTVHTQRTWSLLIRLIRLWSAWTHFADESRSAQNTICSHRILQKVQQKIQPNSNLTLTHTSPG